MIPTIERAHEKSGSCLWGEDAALDFEKAYSRMLEMHKKSSEGDRLRRLQNGLGHAEQLFLRNIWWPLYEHFDQLYPEYEVTDYKDVHRYIDFAYLRSYHKVAIEIDGLGSHWRDISAWQFSEHLQRQNMLVIDGWHLLRFTLNDVADKPRVCQQTISQLMGKLYGHEGLEAATTVQEREVIRLAARSLSPITPGFVAKHLKITNDLSQMLLHQLCNKHWLQPASGTVRIRSYVLHPSRRNVML